MSLLLAEGRNVLDVAQQAGHKASLSLDTYGHLFADLDGRGQVDAESAIRTAREMVAAVDAPVELAAKVASRPVSRATLAPVAAIGAGA